MTEAALRTFAATERIGPSETSTMSECAAMGRTHGQEQRTSTKDCMLFEFQFPSDAAWRAYLTGFYRGGGYAGSGNRSLRKYNERRAQERRRVTIEV